MRLPQVVGLVFCDRLEVNVTSGRVSLVGLFQGRFFETFPTDEQRFTVYSALYGGKGKGTMQLTCTRLETEEVIYAFERPAELLGASLTSMIEIIVKTLRFPAPGRYAFKLLFAGHELTQRFLEVGRA